MASVPDSNSPTTSEAAPLGSTAERTGGTAEELAQLATDVVLQQQLAEANERALRAQAELENFRKRTRREMDEERRYAALNLVRDFLNVADNLQRAIAAADRAAAGDPLLEGVKMVALQLNNYLEQNHCRPIVTVGSTFDPNLHEAIAQEPSSQYAVGTVTREVRSGYKLHDRVVRPAQVMVSTGAPVAEATPGSTKHEIQNKHN